MLEPNLVSERGQSVLGPRNADGCSWSHRSRDLDLPRDERPTNTRNVVEFTGLEQVQSSPLGPTLRRHSNRRHRQTGQFSSPQMSTESADAAEEALDRQILECEALAAIFDDVSTNGETELGKLTVTVAMTIADSQDVATLIATLPPKYPQAKPLLQLSCTSLNPAAHTAVLAVVDMVAADAAINDREALVDLCLSMQQEVASQLAQQGQCHSVPTTIPVTTPQRQVSTTHAQSAHAAAYGCRMVWFHRASAGLDPSTLWLLLFCLRVRCLLSHRGRSIETRLHRHQEPGEAQRDGVACTRASSVRLQQAGLPRRGCLLG